MTAQTLEVPDGRLVHTVAGPIDTRRPPVVLLHGGALDRRLWTHQVDHLAQRRTVLAVDARGHGESSTPSTAFRQCDDVAALVQHLDQGPAVLVGVSMGAGAAVDTALEHPDLVAGIVASGAGTNEPTFDDPWTLDVLGRAAEAQAALDAPRWIATMTEFAVGPRREVSDLDPAVVDLVAGMMGDTVRNHVRPDAVAPQHVTGSWQRLDEIAAPVLAVVGELDSADHIAMSERLARGVREGRTVRIAGTAHYPMLERPEEWNRAVDDFLAGIAS